MSAAISALMPSMVAHGGADIAVVDADHGAGEAGAQARQHEGRGQEPPAVDAQQGGGVRIVRIGAP